jgi:hypothetical protein
MCPSLLWAEVLPRRVGPFTARWRDGGMNMPRSFVLLALPRKSMNRQRQQL